MWLDLTNCPICFASFFTGLFVGLFIGLKNGKADLPVLTVAIGQARLLHRFNSK